MYTPVAQRKTGYVPVEERTGGISSLLSLSPSFKTQTSTQAIPDETTGSTVGFLKTTGQSMARGYQATGSFIASRATGSAIPSTFTPQGKFQEALFGTKEPISLQSVGEEYPFVPKGSKIAPFIAGAGTLLDLTGAGGVKGLKGLTTSLKAAKTAEEASKLMKSAGFVDDIIKEYAPIFAKTTDTAKIEKGLLTAEKLQNTTLVSRVAPESARTAPIKPKIQYATPDQISPMGRVKTAEIDKVFARIPDGTTNPEGYAKKIGEKLYPTEKVTPEILKNSGFTLNPDGSFKEGFLINRIGFTEDVALHSNETAPITPKVDIAPELQPLAAETQKYSSAEEFVKEMTTKPSIPVGADKVRFQIEDLQKIVQDNFSGGIKDTPEALAQRAQSIFEDAKASGESWAKGRKYESVRLEAMQRAMKDIPIKNTKSQLTDFYNKVTKIEKKLPTPKGLPKLPEYLENLRTQVEIGKETLADMPGKKLAKYVSRETGELPEVSKKAGQGKFNLQGDALVQDIVGQEASLGGDLSKAQELVDEYRKMQSRVKAAEKEYKEAKLAYREEKILTELSDKVAKENAKLAEFQKKNPALFKATLPLSKEATKGAKIGFAVGKVEARAEILTKLRMTTQATDEIRTNLVDYAKKNLGTADRGKALTLIRDAKTQRDLTKAFARINRWAEDAEKTATRNDILKIQKGIMDSPSIAIDYKARVKELMGDFELKGHREDTLARLKATQEFLQQEAAKGSDVEMPRRVLRSLELLNRTPFDEITTNQLTGLKAEMELLAELGRTKFRTIESIWEIQKGKILEEVKLQDAKPIQNMELIRPAIGERLTLTQKFKNAIWSAGNQAARIDKAIAPMDTIFDLLDGGKGTYAGANFRFFKGQVDAGYGRYNTRKWALQDPVRELVEKSKLDDLSMERIGVVAAREQDSGMDKLIASGFTKEEVDAVKLTTQEQDVLNKMRETFDSQFPEIQDVMRRVYNQPVEKVKNYFSFMTDWKAMDESEVFQRFGSQAPEQYGAPKKNVEAGFTKSRVGGAQKIKINAMDVFMHHTDNTSYLLELGETAKMLGEVASSQQYKELVGDVGQLMIQEWIDVIARKGGATGVHQMAWLDTLRTNIGAGILGLKLSTVAIQPTALIDGMGFIGVKYGLKGTANFASSPEWRKFILNMPEIKDRMGGEFALRELTDDNWLQNIQRKGFIPMQTLDQLTAGSIATGAYERKMIELGRTIDLTAPYDKEALEYAQLAVRRTQSSGSFKDVPLAVSRGALTGNRSIDRAMLQFQNFLLTRWSRIRHDAIRVGINTKDPKKAIPIFTTILFAAATASGIRLGVNKIQDFISGREDKDTIEEDLQKSFSYEMIGNVPFLGTAVGMVMYDSEMFPVLDAPKGVTDGLGRALNSKSEGAKLRGLTDFAGSLGTVFGIPGSTQAQSLVRGSLQEKKAEPKTKKLKTPPGLPELPSLKKSLPTLPGLPKL